MSKLTEHFPKFEIFRLTSQLKRAVLSIPTNIVEGYERI
ncbi:MAG: four helix bundle protein [Thermodesulfovibrionales bacterium]|nr:four helix bundle protein [Thermodesulfovibrionales bacterium]